VPTQEHPPPGDTGDLPPLPGDEPELGRPDTTYEPPPVELPEDEAPSEEEPYPGEGETSPEEPASAVDSGDEEPDEEPGTEVRPVADDEEEDLWFEKGPPKDFDFDD
jgi:hypothetical protein